MNCFRFANSILPFSHQRVSPSPLSFSPRSHCTRSKRMTKRPYSTLTDSPDSQPLLHRSMPSLIATQRFILSLSHLQGTSVGPDCCSSPSQSPSKILKKQLPLLRFRMSSKIWKTPVSTPTRSGQNSEVPTIVASMSQNSSKTSRTSSIDDLRQQPPTGRLPLCPPPYTF